MGIIEKIKDNRVSQGINNHIIAWIKENKVTTLAILALAGVVGLAFTAQALKTFDGPTNCDNPFCHSSMDEYTVLALQSDHRVLFENNGPYRCMECHGLTSLGPIKSKRLGSLYEHVLGSTLLIGQIQGKVPHKEFQPFEKPHMPNDRCLRCHGMDAVGEITHPFTESFIDSLDPAIREKKEEAINTPSGDECKFCHSYITHPTDGELLPTESSEKYDNVHPGFPNIDMGEWKRRHWHALRGEPLVVDGVARTVDGEMCKICHQGDLSPEKISEQKLECFGCHRVDDWNTVEEAVEIFESISGETGGGGH